MEHHTGHVDNEETLETERSAGALRPGQMQLLEAILRVAMIVGLPAAAFGVAASISGDVPVIAVINVASYLMLFPIYLLRRTYFVAVTVVFCIALLFLGAMLLLVVGPISAAMLWLMMPPALAGLLLDRRAYTTIMSVTVLLFVITTPVLYFGLLPWTVSMAVWGTLTGSYFLIMIALTIAVRFLLRRIGDALQREQDANISLRAADQEKAALLQEVHHRVRNNLQVIDSLLSLQRNDCMAAETQHALDIMRGRICAMAVAYDHLEIEQHGLDVDLRRVIESIGSDADGLRDKPLETSVGDRPVRVSLERATAIALAVTEVITQYTACPGVALSWSSDERSFRLEFLSDPEEDAGRSDSPPAPHPSNKILNALARQAGATIEFPVIIIPRD